MKSDVTPFFERYIGIDYSGAQTPISSLPGLRAYIADHNALPTEVQPPPSPRKYWTRRGLAEWLVEQLHEDYPTIVGIDHAFSFPLQYFERHHLVHNWPKFLDDFQHYWPTDGDHVYVDFIRNGSIGDGTARNGDVHWRRLTEMRAKAKSVFHWDVPGQVAYSTHAGLPWLRYIRKKLFKQVHFWPFDGWEIPLGKTALVEVYPSLFNRSSRLGGYTPDQHDAYSVSAWIQEADRDGTLIRFFNPNLTPDERIIAEIEGWIVGVK